MSDVPAYVTNARARHELGGMSYSAFARLRKKPGFPKPKRNGMYAWDEIASWMDVPKRTGVSSSPLSQEEKIVNAAKNYDLRRRGHLRPCAA